MGRWAIVLTLIAGVLVPGQAAFLSTANPRNQTQRADDSHDDFDYEILCNGFTTPQECTDKFQDPVKVYCTWNVTKCQYLTASCPNDLDTRMRAAMECGATRTNRCPNSCITPEIELMAAIMLRAGLQNFTSLPEFMARAYTEPKLALVGAEIVYCGSIRYPDMPINCGRNYTADNVNEAMAMMKAATVSRPASRSFLTSKFRSLQSHCN